MSLNSLLTGVSTLFSPKYSRDILIIPDEPRRLSLINLLRNLLRSLEADRAVIFVLLARSWQLLTGPATLFIMARYFSPEQQGFHYTFASLLALQSFVELAFFIVIINVASHEWAQLELDSSGRIVGDRKALSRLVSLGRLIFKWYSVVSLIFISGVSTIGFVFFSQSPHPGIHWQWPWLTLVVLTGLLLWILPFTSLLEGCNQVAVINQFRFCQAVIGGLALWLTISLGGGLWAAPIAAGVNVLVMLSLLLIRYRRFFQSLLHALPDHKIEWRNEIWPMQWRLAVSGVVSYFAFSLFSPVMFQYQGAVVAGQMGMTWQVIGSLQALALAWVSTKVPRFGMLIAQKNYATLDRFFYRNSIVSLSVIGSGALVLWIGVYWLNTMHWAIAHRLLAPMALAPFLLAAFMMQISYCQSAYLRAHKQEPLLVLNIITSLGIGLVVWLLGSRFGPLGAGIGYLAVVTLFTVPYETFLWLRYRAEWHRPVESAIE